MTGKIPYGATRTAVLQSGNFQNKRLNTQLVICCDWGTSSFRLYLARVDACEVMATVTTSMGIAGLHKMYAEIENYPHSREKFYLDYLQQQINHLTLDYGNTLEGTPVIISGMASSSIGIRALPYAGLPFKADGENMITGWIDPTDSCPHPVLLLSGVCSGNDVMRGEETQLAGLQQLAGAGNIECVYIFPGTHSKHIVVHQGAIIDFSTYITGELFALLCQHSILKNAIADKRKPVMDDEATESFLQGIRTSEKNRLLNTLFTVRTQGLLGHLTKEMSYYFLSGLLIGEELRSLQSLNKPLLLSAGTSLLPLYSTALNELDLLDNCTIVPAVHTELAAMRGQIEIYKKIMQHCE